MLVGYLTWCGLSAVKNSLPESSYAVSTIAQTSEDAIKHGILISFLYRDLHRELDWIKGYLLGEGSFSKAVAKWLLLLGAAVIILIMEENPEDYVDPVAPSFPKVQDRNVCVPL